MKTKTWTVIANTGKQADLESGLEKKVVQKPQHISARDFVRWLAAGSHIDDDPLRSLFKR
jgi:predicted metalloprotease